MLFPSRLRLHPTRIVLGVLVLALLAAASPSAVRADQANDVAAGPAPSCITPAHSCITVPVSIVRTDPVNLRGYSVRFTLSSNLALCGPVGTNVVRGPYLATGAGPNGTQYLVTSQGGGTYVVDEAILGTPCGALGAGGVLFDLHLTNVGGDGIGTVTINSVTLRDCANGALVATAGAPLSITIDSTNPTALSSLGSSQQASGNDTDGTTKVHVSWAATEAGSSVQIFRKGFGAYPEYDDAGGVAPTTPATPAAALLDGWVSAGSVSSPTATFADEVLSPRDFYYYVAFVTDACGNVSAVSNATTGALNYHLGDVSNGVTAGQGNNSVGTEDVSLLATNYGISGPAVTPVNYLDVGPTTDFSVLARPTTDNSIDFEDLILFAINYGVVSAPGTIAEGGGSGTDELTLETEGTVAPGRTLSVRVALAGSGRIQGLSIPLAWNPAVVEPVGMEAAAGLLAQGGVALAPAPGQVDAALLGVRDLGLAGPIELATVTFRVKQAGDPGIHLGTVNARDARNRPVMLGTTGSSNGARPGESSLLPASPNPARMATTLSFALARATTVDLAVYSVDGRRIASLVRGAREAGFHQHAWDGKDDAGVRVAAGVYYAALTTGDGVRQSRTVILLDR